MRFKIWISPEDNCCADVTLTQYLWFWAQIYTARALMALGKWAVAKAWSTHDAAKGMFIGPIVPDERSEVAPPDKAS
jgi:hypothetical protein